MQKKIIGPGIKTDGGEPHHEPVMVQEILDLLQVKTNGIYIDGTLGLGGHSRAILEASGPEGKILGIDRDQNALKIASERLAEFGPRINLQYGSYDQTPEKIAALGWGPCDGMLLDLGLSSYQLWDAERGFSFLKDSALDMRMDLEERVTARELINQGTEKTLEAMFREYGEERFSKRIAKAVVLSRRARPIETTQELCEIISRALPFKNSKINPATRVFQALRIAVNQELKILERFLKNPPEFLRTGGVLAILTYHSLEDRLVKRAFRTYENFRILTKKPLPPSRAEILKNPRSRSAKLRAVQRMEF